MRTWLKANGGPLALVVLGLGIGGFTNHTAGVVLIGLGLIAFGLIQPPVARYFGIGEHPLAASDAAGELLVEVVRQEWHPFGQLLISVVEVRVTNQTDVRKRFSGIGWLGPMYFIGSLSAQERRDLAHEEERLVEAKARLLTPQRVLEAKASIQGWVVRSWALPTVPNIATPGYTFIAYDELNREYPVNVPETK